MEEKLIELLIKHEGLKLKPYKCPAGFWTIGVGHNLQANPLTKEQCDKFNLGVYAFDEVLSKLTESGITKDDAISLLKDDISIVTYQLIKRLSLFSSLPEQAKIAIIDVAFNIGVDGLLKFTKTLALLADEKYKEASKEILNSKWATQVGNRAHDISEMLANC